jgi:hypothetical protein
MKRLLCSLLLAVVSITASVDDSDLSKSVSDLIAGDSAPTPSKQLVSQNKVCLIISIEGTY